MLGIVGESGCGKSVTCMSPRPAAARDGARQRQRVFGGVDLLALSPRRAAARPRPRDLVRLPGADDLAEPGVHGRRARSARCCGRTRPVARDARARAIELLRARPHPGAGAPARRVSASAVGRDAAARDDRDGARVRSEDADRRRADDRARRDDPGGDPRPDARHPRAARHGDDPDHAQPRRRRGHRRPRARHVRRPQGRGGAGRRPVRRIRSTRTRSACSARSRGPSGDDDAPAAARDPGPRAVAARSCRRRARSPTAARAPTSCRARRSRSCARCGRAHLVACFHPGRERRA